MSFIMILIKGWIISTVAINVLSVVFLGIFLYLEKRKESSQSEGIEK